MRRFSPVASLGIIVCVVALISPAFSQRMMARPMPVARAGAGGTLNLPCNINDNQGNNWTFYQGGWFRQQTNIQIYSQGAQLMMNGNYINPNNNVARQDEKTGELIFEGLVGQGCSVTRRMQVLKDEGTVRVVDIIRNTQGQDATFNIMVQSQLNYSITSPQTVPDPKAKGQNMGAIAATGANRSVAEVFSGRSSKVAATVNLQQNNSYIQATYALAIPAGKEVAIMHLHTTTATTEAANKWMAGLREANLMKDIPVAIRKLIVNFRGGTSFIGDIEILRGEMLDVLELRGGDQLRGTLADEKYKLKTFYGPVELAADRVIGIINVGDFRPRQLLVTRDGEIYGGELEQKEIVLTLSSGQKTPVPLSQISRVGYRKKTGESEDWTFEKPMVVMRSGERMVLQMPEKNLEVLTRYGTLKLKPETVAAVAFQAEEHGVHQVFLADGSKFAGLVAGDTFEMKLGTGDQSVKFPASGIARLQLAGKIDDPDDATATLNLANDDLLVGTLTGTLKLDTAFSTIALNTGEIRKLTHNKASVQDVQVVLWDETTVSGQLQEQDVACKLKCGVEMKVPVALIEEYNQPRPQPSASTLEAIQKLIQELDAEEAATREAAQKRLISMGTVIINTLKDLRPKQSPEAQNRIDQILKELDKIPAKVGGSGTGTTVQPMLVPEFNKD